MPLFACPSSRWWSSRIASSCFVSLALGLLAAGCGAPRGEIFPVAAYLQTPENLQGNRYLFEAEVDTQIDWREGVGRLVAVRPLGAGGADARIPVFLADSLSANLMVAQRYRFEVLVRRGGLLHVVSLRKL